MRVSIVLALMLVLTGSSAALAQDVRYNFDKQSNFSGFKTYRWVALKGAQYRVNGGEWTVLDFNFAFNPPCAYSRYTLCPLPPPENTLPVGIEAGLKRLPSAQGYSPS